MQVNSRVLLAIAFVAGAASLAPAPAAAATLSYERIGNTVDGTGFINNYPSLPTSDTYGRTFTAPTTLIPGSSFGFYDDFLFHIEGAVANSVTSTINLADVLGINNLQVRLYNVIGNTNLPVLGQPANSIDVWSQEINFTQGGTTTTVQVLPPTPLVAGTYVLEVRGNVVGQFGGSYSGTLNLTSVPLPAALPLLLSGLGMLGFGLKRGLRAA